MDKVRIILASNHELWWEGLALLFKYRSKDIEVLATCYDAVETINRAKELRPDIILLDEEIEGGDCGEVAQQISELQPDVKIIILVKPYKNISVSSSFKARAKAYMDKDITYNELEHSIRCVAKGGVVVISPQVAQRFLEQVASYGGFSPSRIEYDIGLSKREKEVLTLLSQRGTSNKEIAQVLNITENTVKAHLSRILEKMQVRTRQQAAILAREHGIVPDIDDIFE